MSAVAAINLSSACSGWGARSRPHVWPISSSTDSMCCANSHSTDSSQVARIAACAWSPRCWINSTPRRNSPTVTTDRYKSVSCLAACRKKARTPLLARSRFLTSLMTLVSIKYTCTPNRLINAFEIGVLTNVGHASQDLSKSLALRRTQSLRKNLAMLSLRTPTVCSSLLPQPLYQRLVNPANQKICHDHLLGYQAKKIALISSKCNH